MLNSRGKKIIRVYMILHLFLEKSNLRSFILMPDVVIYQGYVFVADITVANMIFFMEEQILL